MDYVFGAGNLRVQERERVVCVCVCDRESVCERV